jgi:hypothetical protein
MPRKVEITLPSHQTDELIPEIKQLKGMIGLRLQRNASIHPPGDVITVEITNRAVNRLLRLLEQHGVGRGSSSSITTSEPFSLISASAAEDIEQDTNDVPWEEMKTLIANDANMNVNVMIAMFIAGVFAAIGIATNALHIVMGGMIIAPGFEPIVQISLGAVARNQVWRSGLINTAKGYAAVIAGAAIAGLVLQALGIPLLEGKSSYLPAGVLFSYWTNITASSIIVSALAGIAGALLIASRREVLTSGVMIALALIPAATVASLGLITGRLDIVGKGLLRWAIEVGLIIASSALVFIWKRRDMQHRKML